MPNLATNVRWGTASPAIYFDVSYTATRSGANMVYTINVDFQALTSAYGRYFGYPIYLDLSLDGVAKVTKTTVKNASPSNWSAGQVYYHSSSFSVAKTTGTTALVIKIYSGEGSSRSQTYSYSLPVSPAASEMTVPNFTVNTAGTISLTRYNSGFTDTITYQVGSAAGTVVSGNTASSVSWTPPKALYLQMIGKSSITGTLTCKTYSGSTLVGETTKSFTLNAGTVYYPPNVSLSYVRGTGTSSSFVESDDGPNLRVRTNITIYGGLTATYILKLDGVEEVNTTGVTTSNRVKYIENVSSQVTHTLTATVTDTIGSSASYSLTISTQAVPLNINVSLPAIAFGKLAESAKTLELAADWKFKMAGDGLLTMTHTNNSYVDATSFGRLSARRKNGILFLNGNLSVANMPSGSSFTEIGTISGWNATEAVYLNIPAQNGTGVLLLEVLPAGVIQIYNGSGSTINSFCRFQAAVPSQT